LKSRYHLKGTCLFDQSIDAKRRLKWLGHTVIHDWKFTVWRYLKNDNPRTVKIIIKRKKSEEINTTAYVLTRDRVLFVSKLSKRTDSWKLQSSNTTAPEPEELL
jgi:hypothetical protein